MRAPSRVDGARGSAPAATRSRAAASAGDASQSPAEPALDDDRDQRERKRNQAPDRRRRSAHRDPKQHAGHYRTRVMGGRARHPHSLVRESALARVRCREHEARTNKKGPDHE